MLERREYERDYVQEHEETFGLPAEGWLRLPRCEIFEREAEGANKGQVDNSPENRSASASPPNRNQLVFRVFSLSPRAVHKQPVP